MLSQAERDAYFKAYQEFMDKKLQHCKESYGRVSKEVYEEYTNAVTTYGSFQSAHEGWAILKEELDELWEEVRKKPEIRDKKAMKHEALQVAAMAIRFIVDVTE